MKRPIAFVVLAGVAALLASVLVYSALKKREGDVQKAMASTVEIVVAARDLPLGSKIDPTALKMARWSRESTPPGSFTDSAPLLNAFVKSSLVENEPVVAAKLFMGQKSAGVMPLLIPPGMRAMSVPVDEVSDIAGFVLPHARVDVLVALSNSGGGSTQKPFSKMVLQNVEVLAVAQEIEGKKDEPEVVKVVTLLVTPPEAERLALASHEGVLRLAMRNYSDDKIVLTTGSDVEGMLHSFGAMPVIAHQTITGRVIGNVRPAVRIEIMRDGKTRQSVSFVSDAIGPTSVKKSTPIASVSPDRAAGTDTASAEPAATDGSAAEAPDKGERGAAEPAAPEKTGASAGFAPIPKTIDVP